MYVEPSEITPTVVCFKSDIHTYCRLLKIRLAGFLLAEIKRIESTRLLGLGGTGQEKFKGCDFFLASY